MCDAAEPWIEEAREVKQVVRGETFTVESTVTPCKGCGFEILSDEQLNELSTRASDAYRKKHGLLTSAEIVALRRQLSMSQRKFSQFVGVGEASIKRWEKACIQDPSSDALIREKTSPNNKLSQILTSYIKGSAYPGRLGTCNLGDLPRGLLDVLNAGNVFVTSRAYQFLPAVCFGTVGSAHSLGAGITIQSFSLPAVVQSLSGWGSIHGTSFVPATPDRSIRIEGQVAGFEISFTSGSFEKSTGKTVEREDNEYALPLAA